MKTYTSIEQIKQDIDNGTKVYWMHKGYIVIKDSLGEYGILCTMNDNYVGIQSAQNPKAYFAEWGMMKWKNISSILEMWWRIKEQSNEIISI